MMSLNWIQSAASLLIARLAILAALVWLPSSGAVATMTLPGGDTLANGAFNEIKYGVTGDAFATPFLFVSELGSTEPPSDHAAVSELTFGYALAGLGTPALTITYSITNDGLADFNDLRFIMNMQVDGSGSFNDTTEATWGAAAPGTPDQYQIDDFFTGDLIGKIQANNGLDGSDACGMAVCDADLALQWNIPSLAPSEVWIVMVGLSDDASTLSGNRYLTATSFDTADTQITFSGTSTVVPEPSTALLVLAGLAGIAGASRTRSGRTGALRGVSEHWTGLPPASSR
jgi:hypothetical protein